MKNQLEGKRMKTEDIISHIEENGVDSVRQLNLEFKVVFQPKQPELYGKRRIAVGVYSLWKYIGRENANTAILLALDSLEDSFTKKFRKYGRVDFYKK